MPYLSASSVVIHYEEVLYQVYAHLPLRIPANRQINACEIEKNNLIGLCTCVIVVAAEGGDRLL